MKNYIHIGLGKTATTSLQTHVYPHIPKIRPQIKYNNREVIRSIDLWMLGLLDNQEYMALQNVLAEKNHLISREHLINWNPRKWKESADKNLKIFGANSTIIITVRETESYLRSIYQQIIHEGNIISPNDFFLCSKDYDFQEHFFTPPGLKKFDVDSYDLSYLIKIYEERFDKVFIVPLNNINELEFMTEIFNLNTEEHSLLCKYLNNGRKHNHSYSDLAMKLTFLYSNILQMFGLEIRGSDSKRLEAGLNLKLNLRKIYTPYKKLSFRQKIFEFFPRAAKKILKFIKWRYIMQNIISRYISNTPYALPESCYRNINLAKKNDNLIRQLNNKN